MGRPHRLGHDDAAHHVLDPVDGSDLQGGGVAVGERHLHGVAQRPAVVLGLPRRDGEALVAERPEGALGHVELEQRFHGRGVHHRDELVLVAQAHDRRTDGGHRVDLVDGGDLLGDLGSDADAAELRQRDDEVTSEGAADRVVDRRLDRSAEDDEEGDHADAHHQGGGRRRRAAGRTHRVPPGE